MYVWKGSPVVEMPIGSGVPTGPRGGTHRDRGSNIPTPRYHRYRVTHAGSYLRIRMRFLKQLYSRQLRVNSTLIFRGAVLHRARKKTDLGFLCIFLLILYYNIDNWQYEVWIQCM